MTTPEIERTAHYLNAIANSIALGNCNRTPQLNSKKEGNNMAGKKETTKTDATNNVQVTRHGNAGKSDANDALLIVARKPSEIAEELASGEYIKKPEVVALGLFNIVGVTGPRNSTYNNKPQVQYVFELQFLTGDSRGARALCSFEVNIVREKLAAAVRKYGAVGPYRLEKNAASGAYYFVDPDTGSAMAGDGDSGE